MSRDTLVFVIDRILETRLWAASSFWARSSSNSRSPSPNTPRGKLTLVHWHTGFIHKAIRIRDRLKQFLGTKIKNISYYFLLLSTARMGQDSTGELWELFVTIKRKKNEWFFGHKCIIYSHSALFLSFFSWFSIIHPFSASIQSITSFARFGKIWNVIVTNAYTHRFNRIDYIHWYISLFSNTKNYLSKHTFRG